MADGCGNCGGWGKPHPYSGLLGGFDEELGVFDWCVLEDAVA